MKKALEELGFMVVEAEAPSDQQDQKAPLRRNPTWSRDELILALDLYVRFRGNPPGKGSGEIIGLSEFAQ